LFDIIHSQCQKTEDIFVQAKLTLHLGHESRLRVQPQQHVVTLAILLDPVGKRTQTSGFALFQRTAFDLKPVGDAVGDTFNLHLGHIVSSNEHAFVKRHKVVPLSVLRLGKALACLIRHPEGLSVCTV